jgi:acyl carrier protein
MTTFDTIRQMISDKKGIDINQIKPETTLEELDIDSLDMFDLIFEAEEKFNIKVPNKDLTIKDIKGLIILIESLKI